MRKVLQLFFWYVLASSVAASQFNVCKDLVIDQVTERAFGQQGAPYTGEVLCYRDEDNTIPKSRRAFDDGRPIGRHICYDKKGIPHYSVSYDQSLTKKYSYNYANSSRLFGARTGNRICQPSESEPCWRDRSCKGNEKECVFSCK